MTLINNHFSFGEFEIDPDRRLLLRGSETVPIKAKTFDLLLALVESRGEVLSKSELLDKVWENQFVEENNLTVHVAALRKALGEKKNENRYIVTVPGKGYRFVAVLNDPVEDLVVERRSLSRIIVEEEIDEIDGPDANRIASIRWSYLAGGILATLLIVVASAMFFRSRDPYNGRPIILAFPQFSGRVFTSAGGGVPDRVAISPDGRTIAFVERRKGLYALKLGELGGNNSVEIIPPADRLYRYLMFSPDGKRIYFTARDQNHLEPALMHVSILGGAAQDLIADIHSSFTFSPDGLSVAYLRTDTENNKISLVTAEVATGASERVLFTREGLEDTIGAGVSWSHDGTAIGFAAATEEGNRLMVLNTIDNSVHPIGDPVQSRIVHVTWMREGNGLLYIRNSEPHPNDGQVWLASYPSGDTKLVTDETLTYSFASLSLSNDNKLAILQTRSDPQIDIAEGGDLVQTKPILAGARSRGEGMNGVCQAPDGKILFSAVVKDSRTIWEMDLDGSGQRQLTPFQKDSADEQISVTPDNRYIIFQSTRTGSLEVWRANRDGSDPRPITSGGGNSQPTLTPDGLSIVFVSLRDGEYGLRRISIDGGEPVAITTEKSTWPEVSPDGRFIAYSHGRISRYPNREMRVIPIEGGRPVHTFEVPLAAVLYNRLRWSPDAKAIIYKDHTQGLWRQNISSDKPEEIPARDDLRIYHFAFSPSGDMIFSGGNQMREIVILESSN